MVKYWLLIFNIISLIVQSAFTILCTYMLLQKNIRKKTTITLLFYFAYLVLYGFTTCLYWIYLIILWHPVYSYNNQRFMYLIGVLPFILRRWSTIFETLLCLERSVAVMFPLKYSIKLKNAVCALALFLCAISTIFNIFFHTLWIIPENGITECQVFNCLRHFQSELFLIIAPFIELFSAIFLLIVLKFSPLPPSASQKANKAVLIIAGISLLGNILPNGIDFIYDFFTGVPLVLVIGYYSAPMNITGVFISMLYYYYIFKDKQVTHITTFT